MPSRPLDAPETFFSPWRLQNCMRPFPPAPEELGGDAGLPDPGPAPQTQTQAPARSCRLGPPVSILSRVTASLWVASSWGPWAFGQRMGGQASASWSTPTPVVARRQRVAQEGLGHAEHGHANAQAAVSADRGHCASPPRPQGLLSALATGGALRAPLKRQRFPC